MAALALVVVAMFGIAASVDTVDAQEPSRRGCSGWECSHWDRLSDDRRETARRAANLVISYTVGGFVSGYTGAPPLVTVPATSQAIRLSGSDTDVARDVVNGGGSAADAFDRLVVEPIETAASLVDQLARDHVGPVLRDAASEAWGQVSSGAEAARDAVRSAVDCVIGILLPGRRC